MKKTALTFGLLSLVMVATSFANPTTPNTSSENLSIVPPGGSSAGGGRKQDFHATENKLEIKSNNFLDVNQSLGGSRKLD
ncbi:hypothetical protein [Flavobacterium fluviale]|uniref:Uncharacterized protein n=1 Tax=Flavobacterium fluviale TaxID=2249356 RepID=A0A344LP97_9FLAO|nr:hypothetical protein [Flavobacterium fluviale]AXB55739.1 hypothetical protein HYN86_03635 [Flavobacterium fluviale]